MRALKQNSPGLVKANQRKMDARRQVFDADEDANECSRDPNYDRVDRFDEALIRRLVRLCDGARPNPKVAKIAEKNRVLGCPADF
jgi:hypothetical protein